MGDGYGLGGNGVERRGRKKMDTRVSQDSYLGRGGREGKSKKKERGKEESRERKEGFPAPGLPMFLMEMTRKRKRKFRDTVPVRQSGIRSQDSGIEATQEGMNRKRES